MNILNLTGTTKRSLNFWNPSTCHQTVSGMRSSLFDPTWRWKDWIAGKGEEEERKSFPSKRISFWILILHPDQVLRLGPTSYMFLYQEAPNFLFFPLFHFIIWIFIDFCCCFSEAKSCPTLCCPTDCSTPGSSVLHYLPEFAQIHVHWVGDTIQPLHPLLHPSPFALNLSQHQGLFFFFLPSIRVISSESALCIR